MTRPPAVSIAFFDVDGTLVPGRSSAQHLAADLGHLAALEEAEAAWGTRRRRTVEELDARWLGGRRRGSRPRPAGLAAARGRHP
ncbi:hypothetical protein [Nonomuraea maritima]|nr:hypothetical protein [Nonomuraea maritima]